MCLKHKPCCLLKSALQFGEVTLLALLPLPPPRQELSRRLQPIKGSDFQLLHTELEQWRHQETAKIKAAGLDKEKELVR